jgi:hypothetical protein
MRSNPGQSSAAKRDLDIVAALGRAFGDVNIAVYAELRALGIALVRSTAEYRVN